MNKGVIVGGLVLAAACSPAPETDAEEHAEASLTAVEIGRDAADRAGIKWEPVGTRRLARTISAPAEVTFDPDRTAHIGPLADGRIASVGARVGDPVQPGAVLAVVKSVSAAESRAALADAEVVLELARADLERQDQLHDLDIDTEKEHQHAVAEVQRAEATLEAARERAALTGDVTLTSPLHGTVITRHAAVGETVGLHDDLFTVADLSRVWVVGRVYERDVGAVRTGAPARLTLEAFPGDTWTGELVYVAGALDHQTRTLPVRIELENPEGRLRPGLFGTLHVDVGTGDEVLAIPADAVQRLEGRTVVFVRERIDDATVRAAVRNVTLGPRVGEWVEVLDGVEAGESVAAAGAFTLKGELMRGSLVEEH